MNMKNLNTMTTKPAARPVGNRSAPQRTTTKRNNVLLKTTLVAGSIAATLWGTNLLTWADAQQTSVDTAAIATPAHTASSATVYNITGMTLSPVTVAPIPTVRAPQVGETTTAADQAAAAPNHISTLAPVPQAAVPNLNAAPSTTAFTEIDALLQRELPSIPSIQIPAAPVTRSRSSR